jgi:hypothetical protein
MTYLKSVSRLSMIRLLPTRRTGLNLRIQRGRQIRPIWTHALASRRKRAHGLVAPSASDSELAVFWIAPLAPPHISWAQPRPGKDAEAGIMTGMKKCRVFNVLFGSEMQPLKPVQRPRDLSSHPPRNPAVPGPNCEHHLTRCPLIGAHERYFAWSLWRHEQSHHTAPHFSRVQYAV